MPDPLDCPSCDAKIIVNGDITADVLNRTCEQIEKFVDSGGVFHDAPKLVRMANKLEDDAFAFLKEVLTQVGFSGPWPKSMSG